MKLVLRVLGVLLGFGAMMLVEGAIFAGSRRYGYHLNPDNSVWSFMRVMAGFMTANWLSESGPSLLRRAVKNDRLKVIGKFWTDGPM